MTAHGDGETLTAMRPEPTCPRCGGGLQPPGLMSSAWVCDRHGGVDPRQPPLPLSDAGVDHLVRMAKVPAWLPWPLPAGWLVTGLVWAGDERSGGRATLVAVSGPAPLGGAADLLVVAEEPGVGLGAGCAGLPGPDPGEGLLQGTPAARVRVAGHETPLWEVPGPPDRTSYVGEAAGRWLWVIAWPETAGLVVQDDLHLDDLHRRPPGDLPFGAACPRLG